MNGDLALFRRRLLQNPKQVSALAPSSRYLARAMADGLGPRTGRVVEFGPGTGRLTRAILDAGVPARLLDLFELDNDFVRHLHQQFPGVAVHHLGADRADEVVAPGVGAVVSGLPLLSMPASVREAIVSAAFRILAPGAPLIQFTYGPSPPLPPESIENLGLMVEPGKKIWLNLPPARVYRFYKV
ncbi:methyltransferase type 12 [Tabrizicola sp.]|uniref:class I SAM-dependent methyltransferase n=1 Tax=Tabrizicola sp. TaxID=2005166 RepID=UPI0026217B2A|nr:methyltransferase type 12 [Tabrizicola sp.]MDM7931915.1 methyltransferase type 12 [Tabrizicola sp.]